VPAGLRDVLLIEAGLRQARSTSGERHARQARERDRVREVLLIMEGCHAAPAEPDDGHIRHVPAPAGLREVLMIIGARPRTGDPGDSTQPVTGGVALIAFGKQERTGAATGPPASAPVNRAAP
jgi:hypothetical protein